MPRYSRVKRCFCSFFLSLTFSQAVETSVFSGGMICSGLLGRFRVLLNYAQGVAWFLPDGDAAEGDGDGDGEGAAPVAA